MTSILLSGWTQVVHFVIITEELQSIIQMIKQEPVWIGARQENLVMHRHIL